MATVKSVLLGIPDAPLEPGEPSDLTTSKVGGSPNYHLVRHETPKCKLCGWKLTLVTQIYCPLEGSEYHRTIYIYGCTTKTCWGKTESWTVIRQQSKCDSEANPPPAAEVATDNQGGDDWGVAADDWGVEADDWGDDTDDWGDGDTAAAASYAVTKDTTDAASLVPKDDPVAKLQEMCIDDIGDGDAEGSEPVAMCLPEETPAAEGEIVGFLNIKEESTERPRQSPDRQETDSVPQLNSHYINVVEEPGDVKDKMEHENRLLLEYRQREGLDEDSFLERAESKGKGKGKGGGGGEGYEKADVKHHDQIFYKFKKRVGRYPQQILRYCYDGIALPISSPNERTKLSKCQHCGSAVAFEMQLMPSLVMLLSAEGVSGPPIEFGTVLVYTCTASCWGEGDIQKYETVLVQNDPDQHLFKL